mmetsp:Transcript_108455/g.339274  ORF Transcript_108455/g.339274 Transcript_108455/m.339274 type:complete len:215 (-) Transcript_108455:1336-1980(-)
MCSVPLTGTSEAPALTVQGSEQKRGARSAHTRWQRPHGTFDPGANREPRGCEPRACFPAQRPHLEQLWRKLCPSAASGVMRLAGTGTRQRATRSARRRIRTWCRPSSDPGGGSLIWSSSRCRNSCGGCDGFWKDAMGITTSTAPEPGSWHLKSPSTLKCFGAKSPDVAKRRGKAPQTFSIACIMSLLVFPWSRMRPVASSNSVTPVLHMSICVS